jgi:hypothetical protein
MREVLARWFCRKHRLCMWVLPTMQLTFECEISHPCSYVDAGGLSFGAGAGPRTSAGLPACGAPGNMTGDDTVVLGSGSKPYTAAGVMRLVEAGVANVDDTVESHVNPVLMSMWCVHTHERARTNQAMQEHPCRTYSHTLSLFLAYVQPLCQSSSSSFSTGQAKHSQPRDNVSATTSSHASSPYACCPSGFEASGHRNVDGCCFGLEHQLAPRTCLTRPRLLHRFDLFEAAAFSNLFTRH